MSPFSKMRKALEDARREYPANEGWDVFPVGSRVVAYNRWGGARVDVTRVEVDPPGSGPDLSNWRSK